MRIKSFTLSLMPTRCKFLLLTAMVFLLGIYKGQAQNLLSEGFENIAMFPPMGWSVSNVTPAAPNNYYPNWYEAAGPTGTSIPTPLYNGSASTPTNSGVPTHSGFGMAWVTTRNQIGTTSDLTTPPLNLTTLVTSNGGGGYKLSFWLYITPTGSDINKVKVLLRPYLPSSAAADYNVDSIYTSSSNYGTSTGWVQFNYTLPLIFDTCTNAGIIFRAEDSTAGSSTVNDIFLDDVSLDFIPPCTGRPHGTVNHITPCNNVPFTLSYSDTGFTNLSYLWQSSNDSVTWASTGATTPSYTATITSNKYFRIIVTCGISNLKDTVAVNAILSPFYLCYCNPVSGTSTSHTENIGNVTLTTSPGHITALNNGNAIPTVSNASAVHSYTNFDYLTPAPLYRDSTYVALVTGITTSTFLSTYNMSVYIDFNHDGIFDPVTDLVCTGTVNSSTNPTATGTFNLATTPGVQYGVTGLRVILQPTFPAITPCGPYSAGNGETEDYLVNIVPDRCGGASNAGTVYASDSSMCPQYAFQLIDSNHSQNLYGLQYNYQTSPDGGVTWGNLPFVVDSDRLSIVYRNPASYRLQMVCTVTHDTTYSNAVSVVSEPGYACYCYSQATGGALDSVDIGAFILGRYTYTKARGGANNSYINNPRATHGRTDVTRYPMDLGIDSTYDFLMYQIMRYATGAPAKITLFIDFNNNKVYDYPEDAVLTIITTDTTFFVSSRLTIQKHYYTVPNTLTGMRLVINSNVGPNAASDNGCGAYTSGETVDFLVRLHDSTTAGIGTIHNLSDVEMYPNPTNGKFKVMFNAANQVNHLDLRVTNITGQQVFAKSFDNLNNTFNTDIDLTGQARGIYFVEFLVDGERMIKKLTVD